MATLAAKIWKHASGRGLLLLGTALMCVLPVWCPAAFALNPELDVGQYAHTAWRVRDGFTKNYAFSLAQTPDGYLWLGTEFGLVRYDGAKAVPWSPAAGWPLKREYVTKLLAARDGTLWFGGFPGLASWKGGKLTDHPEFATHLITTLFGDRAGRLWVAAGPLSGPARICAREQGRFQCGGEDGSLGRWVSSVLEDGKGRLWALTQGGLWRWAPGPPALVPLPEPGNDGSRSLAEGDNGELLVTTRAGIRRVIDGKVGELLVRADESTGLLRGMIRDRHGALWIGTSNRGVLHVRRDRVDSFGRSRGLSGDSVLDLFEDREGNVWVSTTEGLDRFRELAAATITADQGLPPGGISSVMAARDGSVWVGATPALSRWHDGQWTVFRTPRDKRVSGLPAGSSSLYQDSRGRVWFGGHGGLSYLENDRFIAVGGVPGGYVDEIAEDRAGNLWIAHRSAGLLRLSPDLEVQRIAWSELGSGRPARRIAFDPIRGGLWLGYVAGDVSYVQDGKVHATYTAANGLGRGIVNQVRVGADGAVWVATEGGLSRLKGGRVMTLSGRNGLPCDTVKWMLYGDDVWLYLGCGVARIARAELDAWAAAGDEGKAADRGVRATVFDSSDGIRSERIPSSSSPSAARSRDGKLWFAAAGGVSVLDPRSLPHNALPPPVHIEQVVADRKTYEASSQLRLPPLVRDLQIDYTALSLVAPEKNRFRYKLEGRDRDWQDADNRRQAFYTDLGPGNYRFRVIASNNSGVWNEKGAALDFSVAPAYWQTNWFRALCVAALVVLLWALYRLRLRQVRRQFSATLEARVNERTRIARELHDTLLQSFHGLLLRFQTVVELLPGRPAEAKKLLEGTIDQAAGAITEGRDAVQGLRSSVAESNDLAEALRTLGEQLAAEEDGDDRVTLCVEVQGVPRTLHPILRDDVFRIGGEAMRNAFRHAGAKRIEVELRYDAEGLRLRVRDDGKGIAPEVLTLGGREGHFGLHGMRERASLIGGKLTVWSAPDSGTEVELSIPASHAYAASLST